MDYAGLFLSHDLRPNVLCIPFTEDRGGGGAYELHTGG